jgi:hypothetical protein
MKTPYTWILITALACSVHAQNAQTEYLWMDTQGRTLMADFANLDGSIIQMRNVSLAGRSPTGGTYWMRAEHHTAVVESADSTQGMITVLHQNWGRKIVRRDTFILGDLKSGWMRIYRPVARR